MKKNKIKIKKKTEFLIQKITQVNITGWLFKIAFFEWYCPDLPEPESFHAEILRWKKLCEKSLQLSSLSETYVHADPEYYPNVRCILHILLTKPVGSVPCERSFSALRRLKTWNRTTMTEDRLNGLALLHISKNVKTLTENVFSTHLMRVGTDVLVPYTFN